MTSEWETEHPCGGFIAGVTNHVPSMWPSIIPAYAKLDITYAATGSGIDFPYR